VRLAAVILSILLPAESALAGSVLDYIRDYDLNDYAFGVAFSTEQNPYVGAENGALAYPFLTSSRDSAFTDDWFLIRDGGLGVRWVSDSGWELGAIARVQTLGLGNQESENLLGIADRKWAVEAGPTIGWRGWPVHVTWTTFLEPTDRHNGSISQFAVSLPMEWSRGYLVPSIEATFQSSDYADYYYSVSAAEATASRPEYAPGAATNKAVRIRWGYALSDDWLLSGRLGVELLDSAISASPIVDRDRIWSATLGLAYNADIFQPREYDGSAPDVPQFDFKVGAFQDRIDSEVTRDTSNGVPGFAVDIEEILGAPGEKTVLQLDGTLRLGHYHRIEMGFFELTRDAVVTLENDINFGDEIFVAGTEVDSRTNAKTLTISYGYSVIRDAQKELGVMAGVHFTGFETNIASTTTGQVERSKAETPLPVLGAFASLFLREKLTFNAKLQIFRTDFDGYEGSLNYGTFDLQRRIGESFSVGLGYSYYSMKLTSSDSNVNGYLQVRHHGPVAFFTAGF
jgi:outer membrane scaffolding protein for murein synthesis (MipA/OmpV family)